MNVVNNLGCVWENTGKGVVSRECTFGRCTLEFSRDVLGVERTLGFCARETVCTIETCAGPRDDSGKLCGDEVTLLSKGNCPLYPKRD
jgi:hypothetical protein